MKTYKVLLLALIVSAVLSVSVQAGDHRGNGRSQVAPAHARGSGARTFGSSAGFRYGGGRMIAPSQRFSSISMRSMPTSFRPHYTNSSASFGQRQFMPGTLSRGNGPARFDNGRGNRVGSIGNGNPRIAGAGNHVFARRSGDWHRDWDRHSDHWWHGHRCRFVDGSWFIFDLGFFPWYGYPYDYYGYDYYYPYSHGYPYGYDPGVYDQGVDPNYYGQGGYDSPDQSTDSTVAAAQERLAREGYYRGEIDGVFGPATRRAITRYQTDHGLRATGYLTMETRQLLGLRRVAGY